MHQTMTLTGLPSWFHDAHLARVIAATHDAGGELRLVGGVVRDMVRGAISNTPPRTWIARVCRRSQPSPATALADPNASATNGMPRPRQ